jgi:hypothetical protein
MKNLLIYIFTVIITLLLLDIYLGNSGAIALSEHEIDPETGIKFRDFDNQILFNEGFSIKSYNSSELYQNVSNSIDSNNSFRIALIGDSYVKADQVFERQHFGQIMKKNMTLDREIKVVNYGYNGSDIQQMYITQKTAVDPTNPDLVLYFLSSNNFVPNKFADPFLPHLEYSKNKLNVVYNFSKTKIRYTKAKSQLKHNSTIINLIINGLKEYKINGVLPTLFGKFYKQESSSNKSLLLNHPKAHLEQNVEVSQINKKIFQNIDEEKIIFVIRQKEELSDNIKASIKANNIRVIELSPVFDNLTTPNYWEVSGISGHWNKKTHKEIGIYLSSELNKLLSTSKPKLH